MLPTLLISVALLAIVAQVASIIRPTLLNLNEGVAVDYDKVTFQPSSTSGLATFHVSGNYKSTGRVYSAYAATFNPSFFAFYPPTKDGCTKLVKPSISSSDSFDCEYATNGAFFTWDTTQPSLCIGNLISDGHIWQLPTDGSGTGRANFGITQNNEIISGFVDSSTINSLKFNQLITGFGWLVRNGQAYVQNSADFPNKNATFITEKAPRTMVGHYLNGTMILLEIDGEEDINAGPDLLEAAELLVTLGVHSAVNIDGGGSSVSVLNGKVIDVPTCNDTPEVCERADASITCVKKSRY